MAGISGWVFMAIGAIVTLFSNYVRNRGGQGLALFFWVGIAMIGIGVFKIVYGFIIKDKKAKSGIEEKKEKGSIISKMGFNKDLDAVGSKELEIEKQNALNKIQNTNILVCPICGTKHYSNSNFCHMCGTKLK
jgi:hypothetical protein